MWKGILSVDVLVWGKIKIIRKYNCNNNLQKIMFLHRNNLKLMSNKSEKNTRKSFKHNKNKKKESKNSNLNNNNKNLHNKKNQKKNAKNNKNNSKNIILSSLIKRYPKINKKDYNNKSFSCKGTKITNLF